MKITSRFTVAVHTLLAICAFQKDHKVTSSFIASSVNVHPVVIRRTLLSLKAAGMVDVQAGSGGARLLVDPRNITLYDIYRAVDCIEGDLFSFHEHPNPDCPVGKNIHALLDQHLLDAQSAMEDALRRVTLDDLLGELRARQEQALPRP